MAATQIQNPVNPGTSTLPIPPNPPTGTNRPLLPVPSPTPSPTLTPNLAIQVKPSKNGAGAALDVEESSQILKVQKTVEWKGIKYKLSLEIPLDKPKKDYEDEDLDTLGNQYLDILFDTLQEKLNQQNKIKAGDRVHLLFHKEGQNSEIIVYKPTGNFDAFPTVEQAKKKTHFSINTDAAKKLVDILEEASPATALKQIQADPILQSCLKKVQEKKPTSFPLLANCAPLQDENGLATPNCFMNSAFLLLFTDPSHYNLLLDPEQYENKEENPLFKQVKKYIEQIRSSQGGKRFKLPENFLGVDISKQGDPKEVWDVFLSQIKDGSKLLPLFQQLVSIDPPGNSVTLKAAIEDKIRGDLEWQDHPDPDFFCLSVNRHETKPLTDMPAGAQALLLGALQSYHQNLTPLLIKTKQQWETFCTETGVENLFNNSTFTLENAVTALEAFENISTNKEAFAKANSKTKELLRVQLKQLKAFSEFQRENPQFLTWAEANFQSTVLPILQAASRQPQGSPTWDRILEFLPRESKNAFLSFRAVKNESLLPFSEDGTVQIHDENYQVAGFLAHEGNAHGGHYVTYYQDGTSYYLLNDRGQKSGAKAASISKEDYVQALKKEAVFYRFKKVPKDSNSVATPKNQKVPSGTSNQNISVEQGTIEGTSIPNGKAPLYVRLTDHHLGHASPNDPYLKSYPAALAAARAQLAAQNNGLFNRHKKQVYLGSKETLFVQSQLPILHACQTQANPEALAKAICQKALEHKKTHLVIPIGKNQIQDDDAELLQSIERFLSSSENTSSPLPLESVVFILQETAPSTASTVKTKKAHKKKKVSSQSSTTIQPPLSPSLQKQESLPTTQKSFTHTVSSATAGTAPPVSQGTHLDPLTTRFQNFTNALRQTFETTLTGQNPQPTKVLFDFTQGAQTRIEGNTLTLACPFWEHHLSLDKGFEALQTLYQEGVFSNFEMEAKYPQGTDIGQLHLDPSIPAAPASKPSTLSWLWNNTSSLVKTIATKLTISA